MPATHTLAKSNDLEVEVTDHEVLFHTEDRHYRVRGLEKNLSPARLHVNLKVDRLDAMHVHTFDLYSDRCRRQFIKRASEELYVEEDLIKRDLARILRRLEPLQAERASGAAKTPAPVDLSESEQRAAMQLLTDERLLDRIIEDLGRCGLVGEETNKLVGYLACVSRKLPQPLAILIQSSSAAGKTTLMDAVLRFMPPEEQLRFSAMTGQALYYMGQQDLKHKILAMAEEEGVRQASYALKLLQSEGRLTLATTERDGDTGRQRTEHYEVEGPVMLFLTTTCEEPDAELQNRCLVLRVNESCEQTAAIHQQQRSAFTATSGDRRQAIEALHQNAQRLLEPLPVVIPWADALTFRSDQTRYRRDHVKYLSLIAAVTLLHQHQRERLVRPHLAGEETCVVASRHDVEVAGRLLAEIVGHSLGGLMPQTRQLLVLLDDYVNRMSQESGTPRSELRFTQRVLREEFGWSDRQVRRHLARLVELEYVVRYRTGVGNGREYALVYDGEGRDGAPFLLGLVDVGKLPDSPIGKVQGRTGRAGARTGGQKGRTGGQPAGNRRPAGGPAAAVKNGVRNAIEKTSAK